MEVISKVALISINATMAAQLISFLIFLFIINRLMFRPLQNVMREREERIDGTQREIEAAGEEVRKILTTLDREETKAKKDAFASQHGLEREGNKMAEAIFKEAVAEIEKLKTEMQQEVRRQLRSAREHLAEESEKISKAIMEKALGRSLSHE